MKIETSNNFENKNWIRDLRLLIKLNIIFFISIILIIFFEGDILRIFTPFILPLLCLALPLFFFALVIISIIHILPQTEDIIWKSYIPLEINLLTLVTVMFLYQPLGDLRVDIGFLIQEKRFNQVIEWINLSIENKDLTLDEGGEVVLLPDKYRNLTDNDRVSITKENSEIIIFFSRGGGMFEYYPGYMYHSGNVSPPIGDGDIVCIRKIKPNWYDCY